MMFLHEKYSTNKLILLFWTDLKYCQDAVNAKTKHWACNDQREQEHLVQLLLFHLQTSERPAALIPLRYHEEFVAGGKETNLEGP